jgi:DNA replication ATP-dependent helicase Dna2
MEAETIQNQLLEFVQNECLAQRLEMFRRYETSVESRVHKGSCITDLSYLYEQLDGALVYSFKSKSRIGLDEANLVVLNRGKPKGRKVADGVPMWLRAIDYNKKTLTMEVTDRLQFQRFAKDITLSLTLDKAFSEMIGMYLSKAIKETFEQPSDVQELILGKQVHRLTRIKYGSQSSVSGKPDLFTSQQKLAYERAASNPLTLIQGPPGSGKTKLLAEIIVQAFNRNKSVLLTAFTHAAIDHLLAAVIKLAPELKESVFKCVSRQRMSTRQEKIPQIICRKRDLEAILEGPAIIGATVFEALKLRNFGIENFDLLIIDEAGQMPIPHALAPMLIADNYVLAGDHKQLPPVTHFKSDIGGERERERERESDSGGSDDDDDDDCDVGEVNIEASIFQHLLHLYPEVNVELDVTFRMNQELNEFPSREFYFGRLRSAEGNAKRKFATTNSEKHLHHIICRNESVTYVEVPHSNCTNTSAFEADAAAQLAYRLIVGHGLSPHDIGIITPFNKHKNDIAHRLRKLFEANPSWAPDTTVRQVAIETVEKMQGREREVVIVTFCSSKPAYLRETQEFIYKPNRLNVAITRAKSRLFVLASENFFPCINNVQINAEHARVFSEYYNYLCKRRVPFDKADIIPEISQAQIEQTARNLSTVA